MAAAMTFSFALLIQCKNDLFAASLCALLMPISLVLCSKYPHLCDKRLIFAFSGVASVAAFAALNINILNININDMFFAVMPVIAGILISFGDKNAALYYADALSFFIIICALVQCFYYTGYIPVQNISHFHLALCPAAVCIGYICRKKPLFNTLAGYAVSLPVFLLFVLCSHELTYYAALFVSPVLISCCFLPLKHIIADKKAYKTVR